MGEREEGRKEARGGRYFMYYMCAVCSNLRGVQQCTGAVLGSSWL